MIRNITGVGEGKGPYIALQSFTASPYLTGADRIVVDSHPYFAFDGTTTTDPIDSGTGASAGATWPAKACDRWASQFDSR